MNYSNELQLLFSISQMLDRNPDISTVILPILQTICEYFKSPRGMIAILNKAKNEIQIEEAYGLTDAEKERARYHLGEGIIGKVISTGIPRLIPSISEDPDFLNRTDSRTIDSEELAFLCVPIKIEGDSIGAVAIDEYAQNTEILEVHLRQLAVVSSLITQAIRLRQRITEDHEQLLQENKRLRAEMHNRYQISQIIGNAASMNPVFESVAVACRSNVPVYLIGESGTGKDYIARIIHYNSDRSEHSFIHVHTHNISEQELENRLFGSPQNAGLLQDANLGTLYLDEISTIPVALQEKLLNIFQYESFIDPTTHETIPINVRIIASDTISDQANSRNFVCMPQLQTYLSSVQIHIPPLRKRKSDIPLLANHFLTRLYEQYYIPIRRISSTAIDLLVSYHWPGNVRELADTLELASLNNTEGVIHPHHLPPTLQTAESTKTGFTGSLQELVNNYETSIIQDALKVSRGSIRLTAKLLKVSDRILRLRISKHRINIKQFKLH